MESQAIVAVLILLKITHKITAANPIPKRLQRQTWIERVTKYQRAAVDRSASVVNENLLPVKSRQPAPQKGNRGKIEIIGDILGVCLAGDAKRTHIMYRSNLSHDMLKAYTDELISKGMVELDSSKSHFRTTERGKEFLNHYSRIREILDVAPVQATTLSDDGSNQGKNLQSLGMSQDFLRRVKLSADQARDILKGMLYLKERYDVEK